MYMCTDMLYIKWSMIYSFDETYTFIASQFLGAGKSEHSTEATCVIKHTRIKNVIWQKAERGKKMLR